MTLLGADVAGAHCASREHIARIETLLHGIVQELLNKGLILHLDFVQVDRSAHYFTIEVFTF